MNVGMLSADILRQVFNDGFESTLQRWLQALEEAGAAYVDVARTEGTGALMALWESADLPTPSFAPPILVDGKRVIGQTANILAYLGERHGLAPKSETGRLWTNQIQLTVADFVTEIHDVHHPIGSAFYYEDQKRVVPRRAAGAVPRLVRDDPRPQPEGAEAPRRRAAHLCRPVAVPAGRRAALRLSQGDSPRRGRLPAGRCTEKAVTTKIPHHTRYAAKASSRASRTSSGLVTPCRPSSHDAEIQNTE